MSVSMDVEYDIKPGSQQSQLHNIMKLTDRRIQ